MTLADRLLQKLAAAPGSWPELKMQPLPHQERFASNVINQPKHVKGMLGYMSLGSGKTFSSILTAQKMERPIIAVVPASLRDNYKKELAASGFTGDATVISYDEARELRHDEAFNEKAKNSVVIYDEAHKMGMSGSKTSAVSKIPAAKKLMMTGSPIRNYPHELAPLINALNPDSVPSDPAEFTSKFVKEVKVYPGFWARMKGVKPGIKKELANKDKFQDAIKDIVEHYQASLEHFPSSSEEHINVDMSPRQTAAYDAILRKNPGFAYKLKHGIPPGKEELHKYKQFLVGLRQVANTPKEFASKFDTGDDTKIQRMVSEIETMHGNTPNYKALVYSNYLKSGIKALHENLTKKKIGAEVYSGELNDSQKKSLVDRYNSGKTKVLLVSGAGAEGLDLKGTKHVLITEPHWNTGRIDQVIGRARRYKSHAHLPEEERHVHIQHFFAKYPKTPFQKVLGLKEHKSADETLYALSQEKKRLNDQFLGALQSASKPVAQPNLAAVASAAKQQQVLRGAPQEYKKVMTNYATSKGQMLDSAPTPKKQPTQNVQPRI